MVNRRIIIGIITIIPIIYFIGFTIFILIPYGVSVYNNNYETARRIHNYFWFLFIIHVFIVLYCFALYFYFLYHIKRNSVLSDDEKIAWATLLRHFGLFVMPIYWYRFYYRHISTDMKGHIL